MLSLRQSGYWQTRPMTRRTSESTSPRGVSNQSSHPRRPELSLIQLIEPHINGATLLKGSLGGSKTGAGSQHDTIVSPETSPPQSSSSPSQPNGPYESPTSTAVRVQARYAATGSVEPCRQGRPEGSGKLGPYRDAIIARVKAKPDITMPDLAAWLATTHGVTADPSNLSKLLCRHGFSYKKNAAGIGERTRRREDRPPDMG